MISTKTIKKLVNYMNDHDFVFGKEENITAFINIVYESYNYSFNCLTDKINEYIDNECNLDDIYIDLVRKQNKLNKFEIIDSTMHVSQIAECISKNNYVFSNHSVIEEFSVKNIIEEDEQIKQNDIYSDFDLKTIIRNFKKSHDNYQLFYGHFMESILANLLGSISLSSDYLIDTALNATKYEVEQKNKDDKKLLNDCNLFISTFIRSDFDKYITILKNIVVKFIAEIERKTNSKLISVICKRDYSYRGIHAEADYLFEMKDKNSNGYYILADCKNYEHINESKITKFLFQLIGYYQQHNVMRTNPIKRNLVNYNIDYFLIIDPLNASNEFSFYLYKIDDKIDEYIIKYEDFVNKCFTINEI